MLTISQISLPVSWDKHFGNKQIRIFGLKSKKLMGLIMKHLTVLCVILYSAALRVQADFRTLEHTRHNPYVVVVDSHLVSISKNQSHIDVKSVNDSTKACSIEIDPVNDAIHGRIHAAVFASGQKIIVWGNKNIGIDSATNVKYTVLLIDPYQCSYQAVSVPAEKRSKMFPYVSVRVLAYNHAFDIFFPSQQICSPCRFTDQGNKIKLDYQLSAENVIPSPSGFFIQQFNSSNLSQGFFYAYNFDNKTAVMKLLDGEFNIFTQIFVNHTVNAMSVELRYLPILSICYATPDISNALLLSKGEHQEIHCERLDSALKPLYSIRLPVPEDYFVSGVFGLSLKVDSFGNSYIGLAQSPLKDEGQKPKLRFFHLDSIGQIDESFDLGKIVDDTKIWDLYGYFVGDQYCLISHLPIDLKKTEYREMVSCSKLLE